MPGRPALITEADVRRTIRAARHEGAAEVEVRFQGGTASILVRLVSATTPPSMKQEHKDRPIVL